jgi:hypothetical protein
MIENKNKIFHNIVERTNDASIEMRFTGSKSFRSITVCGDFYGKKHTDIP